MKKGIIITTAALLCLALAAPPAGAGAKQRHRWEGVAIGVGAAILGHALIHGHRAHRYHAPYAGGGRVIVHGRGTCAPPPRYYRSHRRAPCPPSRGHWESRRTWVPPVHEKVWNPGHFDSRHRWVPGGWVSVVKEPGYWSEERVWVRN